MNLSTSYLGLSLEHPIVASASPLSRTLDGMRRLEDAGAAAIVMFSLFEEEITIEQGILDPYLNSGTDYDADANANFPEMPGYHIGTDDYLNLLTRAKASTGIPIIGSLNGVSSGSWIEYALKIEQAGADAIELNIYYLLTDPLIPAAGVEEMYLKVVRDVKSRVQIPVAVKMVPFFSSIANMASRLCRAGADGLVLFNRFYQPDFDLENLTTVPHLVPSNSNELRLPLHWTAILSANVDVDLAITTGVHTQFDVIKGLMAGARVTMMASELMQHGVGRIRDVLNGMKIWMTDHDCDSVEQLRGSMSYGKVAEPVAFERAGYMKMLQSWHPVPTSNSHDTEKSTNYDIRHGQRR
jgi:dihydroorotate dehydrogenase (fumarate)